MEREDFEYTPIDISKNAIRGDRPTVILCLGGNIANMLPDDTHQFYRHLPSNMKRGDLAVIGFDLKKNPRVRWRI
jgi:uncharacterized SAM-dependent methyltransferase